MTKNTLLPAFCFLLTLTTCTPSPEEPVTAESQFNIYCGSCHLSPDPAHMPKSIWEKRILPEMAARLGYQYNNYNPLANNSMEENLYIRLTNNYPEKPAIDSATWQLIHDYILALAPDSIPIDTQRSQRNAELVQFKPTPVSLPEQGLAAITNIQFEPDGYQFLVGTAFGASFTWPDLSPTRRTFSSPVMAYHQTAEGLFVTEVGYMNPSEKPLGAVYRIQNEAVDTLIRELHRPVFSKMTDLNGDGASEILVCEFGNLTGALSMLSQAKGGEWVKQALLPLPGTIKVEVADMNGDGREDIIALASQGNEGIYILYQEDGLKFRAEPAIRMGPEYGSSWFELIDYNEDGHLDIVLANGDNADYSIFLKPYHGLRLFLNDGKNAFEEKWFYPIYGATRVLAEDYDMDGDQDFAVMAFFPDFEHTPEESIVFLENKNAAEYRFEAYTTDAALKGRWLVMENGDYDQDGDADILLGSFAMFRGKQNTALTRRWLAEGTALLLLENQAVTR